MPKTMTRDDFDVLVKLSEKGDPQALQSLKSIIASDRDTWRIFGDLSTHVKLQFLSILTRGDVVAREAILARMDEMAEELQQGDSSMVKKLVVDQVVLSWLDVHYQRTMAAEPGSGKTEADFLDRRLARAQKRYSSSMELLARINNLNHAMQISASVLHE